MDFLRPAPPATVVASRWRAAGVHPLVVRGAAVHDAATAADALASAATFPDWAGRSLDALYDALCDLSWVEAERVVVIWARADRLWLLDEAARAGLLGVLRDSETATDRGSKVASVVLLDPLSTESS